MSQDGEDQNDKPYEATRRKLEEARKKGEIVRSQDVVNFSALGIFMIALLVLFDGTLTDIVLDIQSFIRQSVLDRDPLDGMATLSSTFGWIAPLVGILFVGPFAIIFAGLIGTKQILFTGDKVLPKLNRISLIANAKKKYGWPGLFEFAKNLIKFVIFSALMTMFVLDSYDLFELAIVRGEHLALVNIHEVALRWLWFTLAAYLFFAALDAAWQVQEHARKNRMSHKELKDEHKNEEGDEHIRQQRRAKAEEIATNRMLLDVPKAVVVITNPTHVAVALRWDGEANSVPKCVARGTDEVARRIREIAVQSGVPLYRDPPTARELYGTIKIGQPIDSLHFKAVAAAVGYARRIQKMVNENERH